MGQSIGAEMLAAARLEIQGLSNEFDAKPAEDAAPAAPHRPQLARRAIGQQHNL